MISTNEFHNGLYFEFDNEIYNVLWFQHHKPGKGGAVMRVKLKNIRSGAIIERTFKSGEKFKKVELDKKNIQFSYREGNTFHFTDLETYDEINFEANVVGNNSNYLKENMELSALYYQSELIGLEMPSSVELRVTYTEQGIKGDTSSGATKPATLETGLIVEVPLFVNLGDEIRVDARTGEYLERVERK